MTREHAAAFIETGRVLGHFERLTSVCTYLQERASALGEGRGADALQMAAQFLDSERGQLDRTAVNHRMAAERLIEELEHPGARLARRVLSAVRAGRQAWNESSR